MLFRIFLTNLGKYNEGELVGEWVDLPATEEELEEVFERIGINEEYEEWFITDYETDFGLKIDEYENLEKLNELAERLESLNEYDMRKLEAALEAFSNDVEEHLDNLDDYDFYENMTLEDLAYEFVDEGMFGDIPENIKNYIDYDAIARDLQYDYTEVNNGLIRRY